MAHKMLLVSFISCGLCLPAMADSIPTVNATYFNADTSLADYSFSGGAAGNVSFSGGGRIGSTQVFPLGFTPRDFNWGVSGEYFFSGALPSGATGEFGSYYAYYFGGVDITSPATTILDTPGTYTFPAVAKGSFIACSGGPLHPSVGICMDSEGHLRSDAPIVGKVVVNFQGIETFQIRPADGGGDPYEAFYHLSFASTPAPEPASYGFVLIGGVLFAFFGTRARKRPW